MKFFCIGYFDKEKMETHQQSEIDALMKTCQPHMEQLYNTDHVVVDTGLEKNGKYLRRINGTLTVTDGPFTETKEMIGGAFIIEASDINEAVQIASLHPTTQVEQGEQLGWRLEIRPIHTFSNFFEQDNTTGKKS